VIPLTITWPNSRRHPSRDHWTRHRPMSFPIVGPL